MAVDRAARIAGIEAKAAAAVAVAIRSPPPPQAKAVAKASCTNAIKPGAVSADTVEAAGEEWLKAVANTLRTPDRGHRHIVGDNGNEDDNASCSSDDSADEYHEYNGTPQATP